MSNPKSPPPQVKIAPEFSGPGRLASILRPGPAKSAERIEPALADDRFWTVFGVGAIWQAAAENAARLAGTELSDWLRQTVAEAATAQGIDTRKPG